MDDGKLTLQAEMVEMSKKISLLVAGAAVQKYMMKLGEPEQEDIVALISNIVIEVFAMESALLRAVKSIEKSDDEKSQVQKAMAKVFVNDAFGRVETFAKQAFAAIAEGDTRRTQLSALKKLTRFDPVDTVALRREIADSVIKIGRYPF
jgi:hypothetical protein